MSRYPILQNGTDLQNQLQQAFEQLFADHDIGVELLAKQLDSENCPEALLPWLAWHEGVKDWDASWSLDEKRSVIAQSYELHRHQGTRYSIGKSLEPFGMSATFTEWFETTPKGQPGTFAVDVSVSRSGIDLFLIKEIRRLIDKSKRKSTDYSLKVNLKSSLSVPFQALTCASTSITVFPKAP